jgi:hypothetical protein
MVRNGAVTPGCLSMGHSFVTFVAVGYAAPSLESLIISVIVVIWLSTIIVPSGFNRR